MSVLRLAAPLWPAKYPISHCLYCEGKISIVEHLGMATALMKDSREPLLVIT
jgi:hypothetical protein